MRLAIMGDLHYPQSDKLDSEFSVIKSRFYPRVINRFVSLPADCHVLIGDVVHKGYLEGLSNIYQWGNQPGKVIRQVLGNHEVFRQSKQEVLDLLKLPRYELIQREEAFLVFLDTTQEKESNGLLDDEQCNWLATILEESATKSVFIFSHHPLYTLCNLNSLVKQKSDGVVLCLNGHFHANSIIQGQRWWAIQTASFLDCPGVRLVELSEGEVIVSYQFFGDEEFLQDANYLRLNLVAYKSATNAGGSEKDRDFRIPI